MDTKPNYYDVLHVSSLATTEEIKQAYRRLVKRAHPDTRTEHGTTQRFLELQQAYELLTDPRARQLYDAELERERLRKQRRSAFTLRMVSSHPRLPKLNEAQMLYVLGEIKPIVNVQMKRPRLNLCLVLDRSLSMDGPRLQQAKEAATYLIDQLANQDILSIIAFSDRARPIIQGQAGADRLLAKALLREIQPWGGTELLQGVKAGLEELRTWRTRETLDHLILLTDGQTYGDDAGCLAAADEAAVEKIGMTLLGLGHDWNDQLLDEMASRSGGYSTFIDSPAKLVPIFKERFAGLANVFARDLRLNCHLTSAAHIHAVYRLTPDISEVPVKNNLLTFGALEADRAVRFLIELLVRTPSLGPMRILRAQANAELVSSAEREEVEAAIAVEVKEQIDANAKVPSEIVDILGHIAAFKVQEKAMNEVERGEYKHATTRLQNLATHLMNFGEAELARAALLEAGQVAQTGQLSAEGRKRIRYGTRSLSQTTTLSENEP